MFWAVYFIIIVLITRISKAIIIETVFNNLFFAFIE